MKLKYLCNKTPSTYLSIYKNLELIIVSVKIRIAVNIFGANLLIRRVEYSLPLHNPTFLTVGIVFIMPIEDG